MMWLFEFPELGASVPYYGGQPTAEEAAKSRPPLMLQYAV